MSKIKSSQWFKYFVTILIGVLVFASVIPSCTSTSSSNLGTLLNGNTAKQKPVASETKALKEIIANLPTAEEIKKIPLVSHPRLLASESRFAEIKKQIETDEIMKQWYDKLSRKGKDFLEDDLPTYKLLDGKRLFKQNKALLRRVITLVLLYKLENNPVYFDRVWQELKTTADFTNWNPNHFLDTARITYLFALSYDWLYEDWNKEQRNIIVSAILKKGLEPALDAYREDKWWVNSEQNWNQVCNSGIGIGALAIMDEYPEIASKTLSQSLTGISRAMRKYAPDGAWSEGTSYWNFGTRYNTLLLAALNTALNTDFNLSSISGFRDTGLFPIYMNGSSGLTFNFSDGKEDQLKAPQLFWLSQRFGKKIYADYQRDVASPEPLDFIWYLAHQPEIDSKKLPLDKYFRGVEVVSMRSEWENPEATFVGFKAGDNDSNHGNLDLGTFVVDALGVRWAIELGYDDYSLPGYFDKEKDRWKYYKTRAEGQNTIVINPDQNPDQNLKAKARITEFRSKSAYTYANADLTPGYYPKVEYIHRSVRLEKTTGEVIIQDDVKTKNPVSLTWFMHTNADIEIKNNGKEVMLYQNNKNMNIKILNSKPNYKFNVMNAQPSIASPNPKGQDKNMGIRKIVVKLEKIKNQNITILLKPII